MRRAACALLLALAMLFVAQPASAQIVSRFTNTNDSTTNGISNTATPCTSFFTRTFNVGSSFTIADVDIGVLAAHSFRGDLQMFLVGPDGTRVQLAAGDSANKTPNFNATFDDEAAASITTYTAAATATATTVVPPYSASFKPAAALSAFDGKTSNGTWTLQICDRFATGSGTFYQADLYLTAVGADLSLGITQGSSAPLPGVAVSYTFTVTNSAASLGTASGVTMIGALPGNFTYRAFTGTGTYDSATGTWTVGSLAPGQSASITVLGANNSTSGSSTTLAAQITASSLPDPDSTVNNGVTTEDDYGTVTYTSASLPAAGALPAFSCPVSSVAFDWDAQTWTSGALSKTFTVGSDSLALAMTGATNRFVTDPTSGSLTPARNGTTTNSGNGNTLMLAVDMATSAEAVTATWSFTGGLGGLRMTLADVDLFYGQFVDKVTVTGSYNGTSVTPVLTQGQTNQVSGNTAIATALADNTTASGNLVITFNQPVDTVTIVYGPDPATSPAAPGIQAIALMDMTYCSKATDLSLTKTVSVGNPAPGDAVSYTLTVSNAAARAMSTSGVTVRDVLPAGFTFSSASGTGTYSTGTSTWTIGSLAAGASASITLSGTAGSSIGSTIVNTAQITASALADPDSTVNNGVTTEDDYATVSYVIGGGRIQASKTSTVIWDPTNAFANPKAIPGAIMEYCILASNVGSTATTSVILTDTPPANVSYIAGSLKTGTSCAGATTAEDDNSTGTDETDPFGASISGTTIVGNAPSVAAASAMALKFRATVN